jgi:hypothetical protein
MKILLSMKWLAYFMIGFLLISIGSETEYKSVCVVLGAVIIRLSGYYEGQAKLTNKK